MDNKLMFSSKSDEWETPQDFFDELDREFKFTLDACALPENAKCDRYFTPEQDGLKQKWAGTVWCNPPYGREIGKWVKKAYETWRGVQRWLCCFPQGRTQGGSTTIFTDMPRFCM